VNVSPLTFTVTVSPMAGLILRPTSIGMLSGNSPHGAYQIQPESRRFGAEALE
jgi:hypothetical protein